MTSGPEDRVHYTYSNDGDLVELSYLDDKGAWVRSSTFDYNAHRLVAQHGTIELAFVYAGTRWVERDFTHDHTTQHARFTYDDRGRLREHDGDKSPMTDVPYRYSYEYDAQDRPTHVTLVEGTVTTTTDYRYDCH